MRARNWRFFIARSEAGALLSLDHATWAEIERLWKTGSEPLGQVARRFGITHQAISARARQQRWKRAGHRGEVAVQDTEREPPSGPGLAASVQEKRDASGSRGRASSRRAIAERLFRAMETKLGAVEERIAAGGDASPADSERTTRTLNTLVRSLEKLTDYEGKLGKSAGPKHDKRRPPPDDPERRRQELARRIERLLARR